MSTWNWRTNLGGAISVLGTSLIGLGILPQLAGGPSAVLYWVAFTGFCLSALGKALTAFFAADAVQVKNRMDQIDTHLENTDKNAAKP